jgi:hypothetical protein
VIVLSASLRRQLLSRARLVASGRASPGCGQQTLQQAALEILERAGEDGGHGAAPFEILVRRAAARERGLRQALADLDDGYGIVEAAVRDLLDAGFSPGHREAVLEKLAELRDRVAPPRLQRARALVLVATEVAGRLDEFEAHRPEQAPQRAAERCAGWTGRAASRALLIHGFADLTGVAADLVQTLLAVIGGAVLLDSAPTRRRRTRTMPGRLPDPPEVAAEALPGKSRHTYPALRLALSAPSPEAEVRQVAHRARPARRGRDAGVAAIVARELRRVSSACAATRPAGDPLLRRRRHVPAARCGGGRGCFGHSSGRPRCRPSCGSRRRPAAGDRAPARPAHPGVSRLDEVAGLARWRAACRCRCR